MAMKKWEQLQLALDNSKLEEGQGNCLGKTQKLFNTMRDNESLSFQI